MGTPEIAPVNLQDRILTALRAQAPIPIKELRKWLPDVDVIALDCGVNALMRANKVTNAFGRYDLVTPSATSKAPFVGIATREAPPSAEEEAAASLQPRRFVCDACQDEKDEESFQVVYGDKRSPTCKGCHGLRSIAARRKNKEQKLETPKADLSISATEITGPNQPYVLSPGDVTTIAQVLTGREEPAQPKPPEDSVIERMRQRQSAIANQVQALQVEASELEQAIAVFKRFAQATA